MKKAYINISKIYGTHPSSLEIVSGQDMAILPVIEDGYFIVEDGRFVEIGEMQNFSESTIDTISLDHAVVFPTYCDSHTHIVFAEPREHEFELKIRGASYEEIAAAGGGILNSAAKLVNMPEDILYEKSAKRLMSLIGMGTGAIEIKSGYGLTIESELKILRVIRNLKENFSIPIKSTFLGAHAIPTIYKSEPNTYIEKVLFPCIEVIAKEGLADFIDIFVEKNYFSLDMAYKILNYSDIFGLVPKLHVNQLSNSGALQLAVDRNALSADHLEEMSTVEIDYLKNKRTIGTILPSCSFFIKIPYAPARQMIDSGLPIALASDYNPGSTPSGNMNFVTSLACIYQKLTPAEALNAATLNGAYAMNLSHEVGSISAGKKANFFTSKEISSPASIPYSFGKSLIDEVYILGEKFPN